MPCSHVALLKNWLPPPVQTVFNFVTLHLILHNFVFSYSYAEYSFCVCKSSSIIKGQMTGHFKFSMKCSTYAEDEVHFRSKHSEMKLLLPWAVGHFNCWTLTHFPATEGRRAVTCPRTTKARTSAISIIVAARLPWSPGPIGSIHGLVPQLE